MTVYNAKKLDFSSFFSVCSLFLQDSEMWTIQSFKNSQIDFIQVVMCVSNSLNPGEL